MNEWALVSLTQLSKPTQHPTIPREMMSHEGVPVFGANGFVGFTDKVTHREDVVAIGCRGACGKANYLKGPVYVTGNSMCLDDLDTQMIDKKFLYYTLNFRGLADVITGSAQPQIIGSALTRVHLSLPPLEEQKRIAEILSTVDEQIETSGKFIEKKISIREGVLQNFFNIQSEKHKYWKNLPLTEFSKPKQHQTISREMMSPEGVPVFGANGFVGFTNKVTHREDVVAITCRGSTCGSVNYIKGPAYVTGNSMCLDQIDESRADKSFVYYALLKRGFDDVITGSAQPQIIGSALARVKLSLPPLKEQKRIAEILSTLDAQIEADRGTIKKLNKLKISMMNDLLTGKTRVPCR